MDAAAGRLAPVPMSALEPLLGLLRAGEQSAEAAFGRIARRLQPATAARVNHALHLIQQDEQRHTILLRNAADASCMQHCRPTASARRFFARLESRDLAVHLGRIAALDACVCQVLSRILAAGSRATMPPALQQALTTIRRDEGHHVKNARALAVDLGIDPAHLRNIELETRQAFDLVLGCYEASFLSLGIHAESLRRRIRRDLD
jgi:hypothetical protein